MNVDPYQAPAIAEETSDAHAIGNADRARVRVTRQIGNVAIGLFGLAVVLAWMMQAHGFSAASALEMGRVPEGFQENEATLTSLGTCARGGGIIAFFILLYRTTADARALGAALDFSPGWAIGYFFIPIASLYLPYKAAAALSATAEPDGPAVSSPWVAVWWLSLCLARIAAMASNSMVSAHNVRGVLLAATIATALDSLALVALYRWSMRLARGHEARAANVLRLE
jgi:hypothetical protein